MRVAHVLGALDIGGLEILELDLFKNADYANFELIGIHRKKGALYQSFKQTGISLHHLRPKHWGDIFYLFRLRQLFVKEKITIAHCHQTIDALLVWLAVLGLRTRVVVTMHSNGYGTGRVSRLIEYFLFRQLDKVFFVSDFTRSVYLKRLRLNLCERYKVLYNGVDFQKFKPKKSLDLRKETGINTDTLLMGMVGNFTSGRDHLIVCKFIHLFSQLDTPFHFIFVGKMIKENPKYFLDCKRYCSEHNLLRNVTFAGSRDDVPAILSELDLFIYASEHDTFGIAVIEAMYAGIPVFVNDWPVMLEITDNGTYSTVFESKNETDLLAKVRKYIANPGPFIYKQKRGVEFVKRKYSIQAHIDNLSELYRKI